MLESSTVLGFLACRTTRVRLGMVVAGATFRPPALVKAVTRWPCCLAGAPGSASAPAKRRTLRLIAAYANACNLGDVPDGGRTITHKLQLARCVPLTDAGQR